MQKRHVHAGYETCLEQIPCDDAWFDEAVIVLINDVYDEIVDAALVQPADSD